MPWKHSLDHQLREIEFSWGRDGVAYQHERVAKADTPLLFIGLGGAGLASAISSARMTELRRPV